MVMVLQEIEGKSISQTICENEIRHLQIILQLKKKLSETISRLMEEGWAQIDLATILGVNQSKISRYKRQKEAVSESICIKHLKILEVYTIIDSGRRYIPNGIMFYTNKDKFQGFSFSK